MKYNIEVLTENNGWEKSWDYDREYPANEARAILKHVRKIMHHYQWRIVPLTRKPYRRHAAVTPLELRGAIAMLDAAMAHVINVINEDSGVRYQAWEILYTAKAKVCKAWHAFAYDRPEGQ